METQSHIPVEKASLDEVATTVVMARVTDYFGFFVYAIASALVFPRLFFPEYPPVEGMLLSFLVFALAFLARPIDLSTLYLATVQSDIHRLAGSLGVCCSHAG